MLAFEFRQKICELIGPEIGEDFAINLDDRGQILAGKPDHFVKSRFVRDYVHPLIIQIMVIQPAHGLVAPAAIRFYEESDPFWFHRIHW